MEGDFRKYGGIVFVRDFNPLPPHGGRPRSLTDFFAFSAISIHSLRMEGDSEWSVSYLCFPHFNPLPPHGGRPCEAIGLEQVFTFQSTPSAWRETAVYSSRPIPQLFQSTPSAWRETLCIDLILQFNSHFNPLPPHGGRLFLQQ